MADRSSPSTDQRSACCDKPIRLSDGGSDFVGQGGGNVTVWAVCTGCDKPCDTQPDGPRARTACGVIDRIGNDVLICILPPNHTGPCKGEWRHG